MYNVEQIPEDQTCKCFYLIYILASVERLKVKLQKNNYVAIDMNSQLS